MVVTGGDFTDRIFTSTYSSSCYIGFNWAKFFNKKALEEDLYLEEQSAGKKEMILQNRLNVSQKLASCMSESRLKQWKNSLSPNLLIGGIASFSSPQKEPGGKKT